VKSIILTLMFDSWYWHEEESRDIYNEGFLCGRGHARSEDHSSELKLSTYGQNLHEHCIWRCDVNFCTWLFCLFHMCDYWVKVWDAQSLWYFDSRKSDEDELQRLMIKILHFNLHGDRHHVTKWCKRQKVRGTIVIIRILYQGQS